MASSRSFFLPSGARVTLGRGEPVEVEGALGRELSTLRAELRAPDGRPMSVAELPLADFHCLRALARRLGLVAEPEVTLRCANCHTRFRVRPSAELELGPFVDGELDDPELDAPFDFARSYAIPSLAGESKSDELRLEPRSVKSARGLHRAVSEHEPLRLTPAVVRGMGIAQLGGTSAPTEIARLLTEAVDEAYASVADLFEQAHYPARLDVPHECPECGALCWILVPTFRELAVAPAPDEEPVHPPASRRGTFMSVDAFEDLVRDEAERAYRELGVREVDLSVIDDAAEVDDGGESLMGCYRPAEPDAIVPRPAEIRLFYRTFSALHDELPNFDARTEVAETLRHELTHHLNFLAGEDPLDDEERAEIHHERARRVGRHESRRRAARALRVELGDFLSRTWLVWLIALAASLWMLLSSSR